MTSWWRWTKGNPSGVLLLVQLAGLLIYPFLGDEGIGQALFGVFSLVVLAIAVAAVRLTPALAWVSALLGLPVVVLTVIGAFTPENATVELWSLTRYCQDLWIGVFMRLADHLLIPRRVAR